MPRCFATAFSGILKYCDSSSISMALCAGIVALLSTTYFVSSVESRKQQTHSQQHTSVQDSTLPLLSAKTTHPVRLRATSGEVDGVVSALRSSRESLELWCGDLCGGPRAQVGDAIPAQKDKGIL